MDRTGAVQLLRRLHEAQQAFYAGGDEAPVRALLTDDIHWHVPGRNAIAGDYLGIEAVLAYFRRRRDLVDRTLRLHPGDVLVGDGDRIAALTDGQLWLVASSDAGRPWACTRSATGGLRAAGCFLSTRPPSMTSGQARNADLAGLDGTLPSGRNRILGQGLRRDSCPQRTCQTSHPLIGRVRFRWTRPLPVSPVTAQAGLPELGSSEADLAGMSRSASRNQAPR